MTVATISNIARPSNRGSLQFEPLKPIAPLDDIIFQDEAVFRWSKARQREVRVRALRDAFTCHYDSNAQYRSYSSRLRVSPSDIKNIEDLVRIPLVTSTQFKLRDIFSGDRGAIVKVCTSSATSGSVSRVYRDETTLCRFLGSVRCTFDQSLDIHDAYCLHLGPSKLEAGDLWFSYAMATTDLVYPTENFVVDGQFQIENVLSRFAKVRNDYENVALVGAPVMLLQLMNYMEEKDICFEDCESLIVITAGGWKRFSGSAIPRDVLEKRVACFFAGSKQEWMRDIYNMVELHTLVVECSRKVKHIPPWIYAQVLDPRTLMPAPLGSLGLLAFYDPTATSYPGFILSDDLGRMTLDGDCPCGARGQAIELVRRVSKVESRGCALKMDRSYATQSRSNIAEENSP